MNHDPPKTLLSLDKNGVVVVMENKEIPTLEQKQAFWAEQLPNFEAKYWLPDHFDFLVFDMEQGNYIIQDDLDPGFEDDATEIWHRVNTGWAMWKKAIKFTEQKATLEEFVLVPKEPTIKMSVAYEENAVAPCSSLSVSGYKAMIEAQEQSHD